MLKYITYLCLLASICSLKGSSSHQTDIHKASVIIEKLTHYPDNIPQEYFLHFEQPYTYKCFALFTAHKTLKCAYITQISVDTNLQRQGCGSRLLNAIITFATEAKFIYIDLHVSKNNDQAINFYKKYDFKEIDSNGSYFSLQGQSIQTSMLMMRKYIGEKKS